MAYLCVGVFWLLCIVFTLWQIRIAPREQYPGQYGPTEE